MDENTNNENLSQKKCNNAPVIYGIIGIIVCFVILFWLTPQTKEDNHTKEIASQMMFHSLDFISSDLFVAETYTKEFSKQKIADKKLSSFYFDNKITSASGNIAALLKYKSKYLSPEEQAALKNSETILREMAKTTKDATLLYEIGHPENITIADSIMENNLQKFYPIRNDILYLTNIYGNIVVNEIRIKYEQ